MIFKHAICPLRVSSEHFFILPLQQQRLSLPPRVMTKEQKVRLLK